MDTQVRREIRLIITAGVMILIVPLILAAMGVRIPGIDEVCAADPAQPSNVSVQNPTNCDIWSPQVKVTWTGYGSSGYNVYCGSTKINDYAVNSGYCYDSKTTFVKNTTYTYYVRSVGKEDTVYASGTYSPDVIMFAPDASPSPEATLGADGKSATISWSRENDLKVKVYQSVETGNAHTPYRNTLLTETPLEPDQTSYKVSNLEYDTEYMYLVSYVNKYGESSLMDVTFKTKEAPSSGGGSEGPGTEPGGSTEYPEDMNAPEINSLTVVPNVTSASITAYMYYDYAATAYGFKIYVNGKLVNKTTNYYLSGFTVAIPYKKKTTITLVPYQVYKGTTYDGASKSKAVTSASLAKNRVYATKISKNKAIVRWTGSNGAKGYYVYMGSKKIKKVSAKKWNITVSRKNAGKAKFKVIPYIGSKKGKSTTMKAKSNTLSRSISTTVKNYDYGKGQVVLKKISGSGRKYKVTCYAINNRMFKLKKYKKIKITVYADGKKIISKTIKNKTVNVKEYGKKKLAFTIKGKEGDLKHGAISYSISYTPYWGKGIKQW